MGLVVQVQTSLSEFESEIASFVFATFLYSSAIQDGEAQHVNKAVEIAISLQ